MPLSTGNWMGTRRQNIKQVRVKTEFSPLICFKLQKKCEYFTEFFQGIKLKNITRYF